MPSAPAGSDLGLPGTGCLSLVSSLAFYCSPYSAQLAYGLQTLLPSFRRSGCCGFYFGVAVLFCRVCTHVHLDGPTAAALLSIAFLSYKKGTHEKDMGEGASAKRLGG